MEGINIKENPTEEKQQKEEVVVSSSEMPVLSTESTNMEIDTPNSAPKASSTTEESTIQASTTQLSSTQPATTTDPTPSATESTNAEPTTPESTTNADSPADPTKPTRTRVEPPEGMSRNAYKKLLRQQKWDAEQSLRAAQRKEKNQKEKERKRLRRQQEAEERAKLKAEKGEAATITTTEDKPEAPADGAAVPTPENPEAEKAVVAKKKRDRKKPQNITFLIDCSFDDKMLQKEVNSLASQIIRIYSENRKSPTPVALAISSYGGRLAEKFDVQLGGQRRGWKHITFSPDPYPITPNTVYLTTEGTESLTTLEPGTTYIIGGIVDRNRYKGLCYDKAASQGLRTARLPIDEFVKMSSRKVLTCNHVVEIMLKYLEHKDWKTAFHSVIPERKLNADKLTKKQRRAAALERKRKAEAGETVEGEGEEEYDSHEDYDDDEEEGGESRVEDVTDQAEVLTRPGLSSTKRKSEDLLTKEDDAKRVRGETGAAGAEETDAELKKGQ